MCHHTHSHELSRHLVVHESRHNFVDHTAQYGMVLWNLVTDCVNVVYFNIHFQVVLFLLDHRILAKKR